MDFPIKEMKDEAGNPWYKQQEKEYRLNHGVVGSHLVLPIMCECCWMRILEGRTPIPGRDDKLIACIRRVNLDAIAGKSKDTIKGHLGRMKRVLAINAEFGKTPTFEPRGPLPPQDLVGMGVALDMIMYSLKAKGRSEKTIQYETLRQIRSTATKNYDSSPSGLLEVACFSVGKGRVKPTSCPTQSEFMVSFGAGCSFRMGCENKSNKPVSIRVIVELLRRVKQDIETADNEGERNELTKLGAYITMCTAGSLRGNEGFLADLAGLIRHLDKGRNGTIPAKVKDNFDEDVAESLPHVVIALLGKVKGETGEDTHQFALANTTTSGIEVRWWIDELVRVCREEGRRSGPAFAYPDGRLVASSEYNAMFLRYLEEIQSETELIEDKIIVSETFGISRTLRKTAQARATRAGISSEDQKKMNRWRTFEQASGKKPNFEMRDLYAGVLAQMPVTWRYSYAL